MEKKLGFFLIAVLFVITSQVQAQTIQSSDTLLWSSSATWSSAKPAEGDVVTISEGSIVLLDEATPSFSGLTIDGTLIFDRQDLALSSDWILVNGKLEIGTEEAPFLQNATLTLTGDDVEQSISGMGTRGIMVLGELELHDCWPR